MGKHQIATPNAQHKHSRRCGPPPAAPHEQLNDGENRQQCANRSASAGAAQATPGPNPNLDLQNRDVLKKRAKARLQAWCELPAHRFTVRLFTASFKSSWNTKS